VKPSKEEFIAEATLAFGELSKLLPVSWRLNEIRVVKTMKAKTCKTDFDYGTDGGRTITLVFSMEKLLPDWRDSVWTRTGHELVHIRLIDLHDKADEEHSEKSIEALVEEASCCVEKFIMEYRKSRSPHIDTTQAA
jgi:hypothetical protein